MKRALPIVMLLLLTGCAKNYVVHPGSVDVLASKTYDTLLVAQSVLDNAKLAITEGKLPATIKPVINNAGSAYTLLRSMLDQYQKSPNETLAQRIMDQTDIVNKFILNLRGLGVSQ
jgi:hypothetical protein